MPLAFDWTQLAQQTVIGLASGGIWATLAVALVLIYRSTGVVNFAQGEMAMFATFIAWTLIHHGFSYWPAVGLTVLIAFAGGVSVERVVIRPVEGRSAVTVAIVTVGPFFLLSGAAARKLRPELHAADPAVRVRGRRPGRVRQRARRRRRQPSARRLPEPRRHLRRLDRHGAPAAGRARRDPRRAARETVGSLRPRRDEARVSGWVRGTLGVLAAIAAVALVVLLPHVLSDGRAFEFARAGTFFVAMLGLNLLTGYTGQ